MVFNPRHNSRLILKKDGKTMNDKDIDTRIRSLQDQRSKLYDNDDINDTELKELVSPINTEIEYLINLLYDTEKGR